MDFAKLFNADGRIGRRDWIIWIVGTAIGALTGSLLGDLSRFGFDAVMVAYFAAVIVGQWKGRADLSPWIAAAVVAVGAVVAGLILAHE